MTFYPIHDPPPIVAFVEFGKLGARDIPPAIDPAPLDILRDLLR